MFTRVRTARYGVSQAKCSEYRLLEKHRTHKCTFRKSKYYRLGLTVVF